MSPSRPRPTPPSAAPPVRRLVVAWFPAVAWAALIFVLSAQPSISFAPEAWLDFLVRKSGHMGIFGILALLVWWAVASTSTRRRPWAVASTSTRRRPWAWALGLTALYAVTDELHQGFTGGREPTVRDVALDVAGAVMALAALAVVRAVRRRRASPSG